MTIPVSQRAREAAAALADACGDVWQTGGNDLAAIRNGFWDDKDDLGPLVQAFAQFEREVLEGVKASFDATLIESLKLLYGQSTHERLEKQHVAAFATIERAWDMLLNPEKYMDAGE